MQAHHNNPQPMGTRPVLASGTSPHCLLQDVSKGKKVNPIGQKPWVSQGNPKHRVKFFRVVLI